MDTNDKNLYLTQDEVNALPSGTEVMITWTGGNGPHIYKVINSGGLAYIEDRHHPGEIGQLIEHVGRHPLTMVSRVGKYPSLRANKMLMMPNFSFGIEYSYSWVNEIKTIKVVSLNYVEGDILAFEGCPACFFYRGRLVQMQHSEAVGRSFLPEPNVLLKCPECRGTLYFADKHEFGINCCSCGESPHRVSCRMGFDNYFQEVESLMG